TSSDWYSYVISAVDGTVLFRNNLTADVDPNNFTYRVWAADSADTKNPAAPHDGPQGNAYDPHPTGTPDGTQPVMVAQADVTLSHAPFLANNDPWLPANATETVGNNVDAFVDLFTPDGYTPFAGDFRADVNGPNAFLRTYD